MSLHWNIENVANREAKVEADKGAFDCLIMAALAIGLGDLTEKNIDEWIYRLNRYTFEGHPLATKGPNPIAWRKSQLKPWIGLHTNVANISSSAFDQIIRKRTGRDKLTTRKLNKLAQR